MKGIKHFHSSLNLKQALHPNQNERRKELKQMRVRSLKVISSQLNIDISTFIEKSQYVDAIIIAEFNPNNQSNDPEMCATMHYKCICGRDLEMRTMKQIIAEHGDLNDDDKFFCDSCCKTEFRQNEMVFHCLQPSNTFEPLHPIGYDLCAECAAQNKKGTFFNHVGKLLKMGYGMDQVTDALMKAHNDINEAIKILNKPRIDQRVDGNKGRNVTHTQHPEIVPVCTSKQSTPSKEITLLLNVPLLESLRYQVHIPTNGQMKAQNLHDIDTDATALSFMPLVDPCEGISMDSDETSVTSDSESMDYEHMQLVDQLEDIVNKEMHNLMSLYDQLMNVKNELLTSDNSGVISCPLPGCGANNSKKPTSNGNSQGNNKQAQNNGNVNGDNNGGDRQKESNNDGSGDKDKNTAPISQSASCNHLSTCSVCRLGWTQKCEQVKMFKALLLTLQTQHAHHVSFVGTLCEAIANAKAKGNKKSKSKNRRKPTDTMKAKQPSYNPPSYNDLNVKIPKAFADDTIPHITQEAIAPPNVYSYVRKSIVMQHNDQQLPMDQKNVIVNMDFHEAKSNEPLYCIMSKIQNQRYNWQLEHKLYTAAELASLGFTALAQSSRIPLQLDTELLSASIRDPQSVHDILRRCKWNDTPVFNTTQNYKRITLSIQQCKLNPMVERTLSNMDAVKSFIPILMFGERSHWVEHVAIVHIDMSDACIENNKMDQDERDQVGINVGISLRCDAHGVRISGIHLDMEKLSEQHQLLYPHECHCLDGLAFKNSIHDIRVGNPDAIQNKLKAVKQKYDEFKKFILRFINSHPDEFGTFQQQAQVLLMNQNGTLTNALKSVDLEEVMSPPPSSISSSPDYCFHSPSD